jgi:alkylation response protein AidB-like acyl-CoA dehydrogenase
MEPGAFEKLKETLWDFMKTDIYPNELLFFEQIEEIRQKGPKHWKQPPIIVKNRERAKSLGLFNLFLPVDTAEIAGYKGGGLTNLQYADCCEIMGTANHAEFAAECCNCASPDTGNMEIIARFGTEEQKARWLKPLLEAEIRSCYAMTEPDVASSDATNISIGIQRQGDNYVINGRKHWITGAGNVDCKIMILMGKTDPQAKGYTQQSQILVPMDTPGITLVRPMMVFTDDDCPKGHMEILFEDVTVPVSNVLWGEGKGFAIAQLRLGPGRIHHCMRMIGQAERALSLMCRRADSRKAFGDALSSMGSFIQQAAQSRAEIDQARLLVREAADRMDKLGNTDKYTRKLLSLVKAVVPGMTQNVVDRAMQVMGGVGVSQDSFLPVAFAGARSLRWADGPDEVHWRTAGKQEISYQRHDSDLYKLGLYEHDKSTPFKAKL